MITILCISSNGIPLGVHSIAKISIIALSLMVYRIMLLQLNDASSLTNGHLILSKNFELRSDRATVSATPLQGRQK